MKQEKEKILGLLEKGVITREEADDLLKSLGSNRQQPITVRGKMSPFYIVWFIIVFVLLVMVFTYVFNLEIKGSYPEFLQKLNLWGE